MKNTFFILLIFWLCYPFMGCSQNGVAKSRGGVVEYETLLDMTLDADRTGKSMVSFNKESERMYFNDGLLWRRLLAEHDNFIGDGVTLSGTYNLQTDSIDFETSSGNNYSVGLDSLITHSELRENNLNGIYDIRNESDENDPNYIKVNKWFTNQRFVWDFGRQNILFDGPGEFILQSNHSFGGGLQRNHFIILGSGRSSMQLYASDNTKGVGRIDLRPGGAVGISAINGDTHLKFRTNAIDLKAASNLYGGFLQMKDIGNNPTDGDYKFEISDWFAPLNKPAAGTYNWTFDEQGRANFTSAAHSTDANDKVVTCEWVQVNSLSNGQSATLMLQGSPDFVTSINLKFTRDGRNYVGQAHYNFGSNALSGAEFIAEAYMDGETLNVVNESGETISAGFIEICYSE